MNAPTGSPLIVIGMHRSGTSMIASMLEDLGIFMGARKDPNHEALFFIGINEWLLGQAGGAWDHPNAIDGLLEEPELKRLCKEYIHYLLSSPRVISYLGWRNYIRYRHPANLVFPWGWKDPRNTFTLPLWLELFPGARVINVYRNGVDVAKSLATRGMRELEAARKRLEKQKWRHGIKWNKYLNMVNSRDCLSLTKGFALWESYTRRAERYVMELGSEKAMSVRYEDLLAQPSKLLGEICRFIQMDTTRGKLDKLAQQVHPERGNAYERDESLRKFYETVKDSEQMRRYSY